MLDGVWNEYNVFIQNVNLKKRKRFQDVLHFKRITLQLFCTILQCMYSHSQTFTYNFLIIMNEIFKSSTILIWIQKKKPFNVEHI